MSNIPYPRNGLISDITEALNAVVTFTEEPTFTVGEIISFRTSKADGMYELMNNQSARVLEVSGDTVTVDLNTLGYGAFVYPSPALTPPMAVPSSSGIIPGLYPATMNLLDSFDMRSE